MKLNTRINYILFIAFSFFSLIGLKLDSALIQNIEDERAVISYLPINAIDSFEFGSMQAEQDIKNNMPKYFIHGLVPIDTQKKYLDYGIKILMSGCAINGIGNEYWRGYNNIIEKNILKNI